MSAEMTQQQILQLWIKGSLPLGTWDRDDVGVTTVQPKS